MSLTWLHPRTLLFFVLIAYGCFGWSHLTHFVTADEHYWIYERIPQYWDALSKAQWKKTFINDKPGVTLALVSGVGLIFEPNPAAQLEELPDRTLRYQSDQRDNFYRAFRLPVLGTNLMLLGLLFWILGKLFGEWRALLTVAFTAFSPIIVGLSQIVNPDALLWSFGATATFAFLAWQRFRTRPWLLLATVLTALAILTKYVALVLIPLYAALCLGEFFSDTPETKEKAPQRLRTDMLALLSLVIGSFTLVAIFLPALWWKKTLLIPFLSTFPWYGWVVPLLITWLLGDIFLRQGRLLSQLKEWLLHMPVRRETLSLLLFLALTIPVCLRFLFPSWDIFSLIPFDIKDLSNARYYTQQPNFLEALVLEWSPLSYSLTPIVLLGCFLACFRFSRTQGIVPVALILFPLGYPLIFQVLDVLLIPRYAVLVYPFFAFIAATSFAGMVEQLCSAALQRRMTHTALLVLAMWSVMGSAPFYLSYANLLLAKNFLISDAWGYGGYEAAQYLNQLPNASSTTVWADYYGVCEFFVGRCLTAYTFDRSLIHPDYYVLTRRGRIRFLSRFERWERQSGLTARRYYSDPHPQWALFINERPENFVKVYKVRE